MNISELLKGVDNCSCGRKHICPIDYVEIGENATDNLIDMCLSYNSIILVSDKNTYKACGEKVHRILKNKISSSICFEDDIVIPNEEKIDIIDNAVKADNDLIIGVGSGVINDLCKYVRFKNNLPYFIVATAPSMDGYASTGAALILEGMKITLNARPPKAIIADTDVLKNAPMEMIRAGYGDIIGKYSCLNDWELSKLVNKEYFCKEIYDLTYNCAEEVKALAEGINNRDGYALKKLMEKLVVVGIAMSFVGNSRPASGSEHHLSHFFEITGILNNEKYLPHGIDVAYSTVITAKIRNKIINEEFPNKIYRDKKYSEKMQEIYKSVANGCIELQNKVGYYSKDRLEIYKRNEKEIKEILSRAPDFEETENMLNAVGLDMSEFYDTYSMEKITNAVLYAKDLKDRYSVLWLYYDLLEEVMSIKHVGKMTVAAHRGDCYSYYENTMTAFEEAVKSGAHMIETDVRLSKDNVLVLMHDADIDRTTDGSGQIEEMTAEEIRSFNAGDALSPEKVPLFEEFIKWASEKKIMLNIEIKEYYSDKNKERCIRCIEEIIALVEKYNMTEDVVLNSFDAWVLEYIYKNYGKKYMLHGFYPYSRMSNVSINPDEYLYCACIFECENKNHYDYLIQRDIEPWIGAGVTQESKLKMCLGYGARLITTNNPSDVLNKLKRM